MDEKDGIDILGDIIESSTLTVNKALYGDLHNMGHVLLAFAHDPKHKHMVPILLNKLRYKGIQLFKINENVLGIIWNDG